MSLFPFIDTSTVESTVSGSVESTSSSTKVREYEIDFTTGKLTGKIVEGVNALAIWAKLALSTKRYHHIIYSWYYGEEFTNLIGYSYSEEYLYSEVKRYIEDCVSVNPNITGIKDLVVSQVNDKLTISFTMITAFGEVEVDV